MKYLIPSLLTLLFLTFPVLAAENGKYLYTSLSSILETEPSILLPLPGISLVQIAVGQRTFFGKHALDLSGGLIGSRSYPCGFAQGSYLCYLKEQKGIYLGVGYGIQGYKWKSRTHFETSLPITLGYEIKSGFLQAQIQPVLSPHNSSYFGKTRGLSLGYGFKF